jgi:mono/diheme cytochrome c family protein
VLCVFGNGHGLSSDSAACYEPGREPCLPKNCAKCHGKTAEGHRFGGPSLVSPKASSTSADKLHSIIANGKGHIPKFHMPKFGGKLTSEEIDVLVEQIQAPIRK